MTTEDKLKAVIEKAVKNGWKAIFTEPGFDWEVSSDSNGVWFVDKDEPKGAPMALYLLDVIIFDRDFSKALFGEKTLCLCGMETVIDEGSVICDHNYDIHTELSAWEYHLQQLVLLETDKERIDYLYKTGVKDGKN